MINSGDIIRKFIKDKGINQSKLAEKLETSRSNINQKISKKELDTATIFNISIALNHNFFDDISREFEKSTGIINQSKLNETSEVENAIIKLIQLYK